MRSRFWTIIILISAVSAQAATYTVNPDGSGEFATIQAALNAAADGDLIQLGDGTFFGPGNRDLDTGETRITIESLSGDPTLCVIDCQGSEAEPHFGLEYSALGFDTYLRGISIVNGYSSIEGGALKLREASITVENCIFTDNSAGNYGGAVYSTEGSTPSFSDCVFNNNSATYFGQGGAVYLLEGSDVAFTNCSFNTNQASLGGALYAEETGPVALNNCVFSENTAGSGGAAYATGPSDIRFVNSTLFQNTASYGSGVYLVQGAFCRLNNSIIAFGINGSACSDYYGGGYITGCSSIFANQGGDWVGSVAGQGTLNNNSNIDPLFCDQATGTLTLHHTSVCAPENNPCGLIGALPVGCFGTMLVAADGSGDYATIQAALDVAHPGDTIQLGAGIFTGPGNRDLEIDLDLTIESADPGNPGIIDCQGNPSDQHRAFMVLDGTVDISHLIIRNGYSDLGGAISISGGLLDLNYCQFENNTATMVGGGLHADHGDLVTVNYCIFAENSAAQAGGAAYAGDSVELRFSHCTIFLNESPAGSGIFLYSNALGRVNNCIIAWGKGSSACSEYFSAGFITGCNDIYANEGGDWVGVLAGQGGINNNENLDPLFCDPLANPANFDLTNNSPAGEALACGGMGAKVTDPAWPAPVYGVRADGTGMYATIRAAASGVPFEAVIALDDGTYLGEDNRNIVLHGKRLRVIGRNGDATAVIIDAEGSHESPARGFYLFAGEPEGTSLEYLTIRGGYCNEDNNTPTGSTGGGILLQGGSSLQVLSCRFEDNTVFSNNFMGADHGNGGAIHNDGGGALRLEDCFFTGTAALQTVLVNSGSLDVLNCTFTGNPGCLVVEHTESTVNISGCYFELFYKSAIICQTISGDINIFSCDISAPADLPYMNVDSAIEIHHSPSAVIDQCQINKLHGYGYLMLDSDLVVINESNAQILNTTFSENSGGSTLVTVNAICQVSNCNFIGNNATFQSPAMEVRGGTVDFNGCTFADNSGSHLGTVVCDATDVSFDQCDFTGNQSNINGGGGLFIDSSVTMTRSNFVNNTAPQGGGFYADQCDLLVEDCTFDANSDGLRHHGSSQGGVSIIGSTFTNHTLGWAAEVDSTLLQPVLVDDCTFSENDQGLRLLEVTDFRLANSEFNNNPANGTLTLSNSEGVIDTCSFNNNFSESEGGALYMVGSRVILNDCNFNDNSTNLSGGAIQVDISTVNIWRCNFDRNHAAEHGGALAGTQGNILMSDSNFDENQADQTGGSIYTNDVQSTFGGTNITGGLAGTIGGASYHRYGLTSYYGGQIASNGAENGGGIATSLSNVLMDAVEVSGNTANNAGGLSIFASDLVMESCTVSGNSASNHGGVYIYNNCSGQINQSVFTGNSAGALGSGLSVYNGADLVVTRSTFAGNGGGGSQGQVFCSLNSTLDINASIVAFASTGSGVAIADTTNSITVEGSNIFGNAGGDWIGPLAGLNGNLCNFSLDPQFCDQSLADYHLTGSSPCAAANNSCGLDVGALGVGCTGVSPVPETELPRNFAVLGNHPNPFNPRTEISFELPQARPVVVEIYDLTGRLVRRLAQGEIYAAGSHKVTWEGADDKGQPQSSGVYLYRVFAAGKSLVGKMAMIR